MSIKLYNEKIELRNLGDTEIYQYLGQLPGFSLLNDADVKSADEGQIHYQGCKFVYDLRRGGGSPVLTITGGVYGDPESEIKIFSEMIALIKKKCS